MPDGTGRFSDRTELAALRVALGARPSDGETLPRVEVDSRKYLRGKGLQDSRIHVETLSSSLR
jgi:hypothetical protein